jgi:hypothetical protein
MQESERITSKADCYGFAVLMWETATRLYPWHGLGLLHVRVALCTVSTRPGLFVRLVEALQDSSRSGDDESRY